MLECRRQLEVSGFDHSSIKEMIQLAKQHKQHNVRLYFFIPPNHATHEETLRLLGLTSLFHQWLREISDLLARQTEREDTDLFQLWDFSGYNIVTMEPIPPQNSPVHMRGYFDPIHYTTWVGSEILKVLLQQPGPDTELADFGVRVDRRSISAHLERQNQNRMLYLTAHPEIPQQIKALYKGDKPATGSAHASPTPADCSAS
jgi:hypothetical protein